jgi:hypothetical protein
VMIHGDSRHTELIAVVDVCAEAELHPQEASVTSKASKASKPMKSVLDCYLRVKNLKISAQSARKHAFVAAATILCQADVRDELEAKDRNIKHLAAQVLSACACLDTDLIEP